MHMIHEETTESLPDYPDSNDSYSVKVSLYLTDYVVLRRLLKDYDDHIEHRFADDDFASETFRSVLQRLRRSFERTTGANWYGTAHELDQVVALLGRTRFSDTLAAAVVAFTATR